MTADNVEIERGSGNGFANLGLQDAEAHLLKAQLVTRIDDVVRRRGLKQVEVAKLLGLSQPDVSRLLRDHRVCARLRGADSAEALYAVLTGAAGTSRA